MASDRLRGEAAGFCASSEGSSPSRSMDKKRMRMLDRKCTKAEKVFKMWEKYDLDPNKFPGRDVAKAKADFSRADAKRKELRHKLKRVVILNHIQVNLIYLGFSPPQTTPFQWQWLGD